MSVQFKDVYAKNLAHQMLDIDKAIQVFNWNTY